MTMCYLCEGVYNHCTLNRIIGEHQGVSPWQRTSILLYIATKYCSVNQELVWKLSSGRFLRELFFTCLCKQAGSLANTSNHRVKISYHVIIPLKLLYLSGCLQFFQESSFFNSHQYVYWKIECKTVKCVTLESIKNNAKELK